jgi:glycosyltransferase involved in cell wall biosynthesis
MFVALMTPNTEPVVPKAVTEKDDPTHSPEILLMIPTLNEEEAIQALVKEAQSKGFGNILVVDGFSTDRTREVAAESGARVVLQDFGKGKGCGVRSGMKEFISGSSELLCIIDGDGTNDPTFLTEMIQQVRSGKADVVLGSRTRGPREPNAMDTLTLASNVTVSFLLGAKFGRLFTDVQTGYWVFTRNAVQRIYPQIRSTGFEVELELFVRTLKEELRVHEVPVGFRRRSGHTKFSFMLRMRNLYYAFRFLAS